MKKAEGRKILDSPVETGFVDRIEQQLLIKNLKRTAFAKTVGVTNQAFTDWKRRGTMPAADIVLRIADALNIDFRWLITGKEKESPAITRNLPPEHEELCRLYDAATEDARHYALVILRDSSAREKSGMQTLSAI